MPKQLYEFTAHQSRASFIRSLLNGLHHIPQISHPKAGALVRTRFNHTHNLCQTARLLNQHFNDSILWPQLCLRLACHDIGHTPYAHAGERVIQKHYDPVFSNSAQSRRFMYAGSDDWPDSVEPFGWYTSEPILRLCADNERKLNTLVEFFDDLENAIGDAIDLKTLGHKTAYEFMCDSCCWSSHINHFPDQPLPDYLKRIVLSEFTPIGFGDLADKISEAETDCLQSVNKLRRLIKNERMNSPHIAKIDAVAENRIPKIFEQASDRIAKRFNIKQTETFVTQMAIDIISSTNELVLT